MALNVAQRHRDEELLDTSDRPADNPDADVDSEEKIAKITHEIEVLQKQMKDVTGMISGQPTGKTEFFSKKAELQRQLDDCSRFIDDCQAKTEALSRSAGRGKGSAQPRSASQRRTPSKHSVSAEVEEQISAIEQRMLTETLTLREQKQLLTEVARLKADPHDAPEGTGNGDMTAKDGSLEEISKQLLAHREKKRVLQAEYAALVSARKSQLATLPRLHEEREALSQKLGAKIRERAAMRETVRAADKRFGQQLVAAQRARDQEARRHTAEGARERNDIRRQREADKLEEKPCQLEMALVEQTIKFCRSFLKVTEVAKREEAAVKYDTPAGAVVLLGKDQRDDPFIAPAKRGKSNKSKAGKSTTIKHNAETFKFFEKLGIDAPTTTDEVPATLEKLEVLMQGYTQRVEEWAKRRTKLKKNILDEQPVGEDQSKPGKDDIDNKDLLRGGTDGVDVD